MWSIHFPCILLSNITRFDWASIPPSNHPQPVECHIPSSLLGVRPPVATRPQSQRRWCPHWSRWCRGPSAWRPIVGVWSANCWSYPKCWWWNCSGSSWERWTSPGFQEGKGTKWPNTWLNDFIYSHVTPSASHPNNMIDLFTVYLQSWWVFRRVSLKPWDRRQRWQSMKLRSALALSLGGRLVLTSCGTTWNTLVLRAKSCGVTDRSADHLV